ncbi:MAG TPA: radical SAM protein [Bdellovibrionales bacterium]|nr:radical SAM protein [Bdellovibrionales bacterium]
MKRYAKVHIEISNVCNLKCGFCPAVVREHKLMDLELFRSAIRQVAPIAEQVALHLMGDPLVHPRLQEFVEIAHAARARLFLVTNGVLLREKQVALLLHPAFRQVNFSLHSFPDNFPDRDPAEYLEKIFAYTERALEERPELYLNYRLWNLREIRGQRATNLDILRRVGERFGVPVPTSVDVLKKKSHRLVGRLYLHFDTEFVWPDLALPVLGERGRCHGLSSHFGILVDGTVVPCCLDKEGSIPLGRLIDQPLERILNGPRAQAMLDGFRKRHLVEDLCRRCQYIERFGAKGDRSNVPQNPGPRRDRHGHRVRIDRDRVPAALQS